MKPKLFLFVGGVWDGQRRMVEDGINYFDVAKFSHIGYASSKEEAVIPIIHKDSYVKVTITGGAQFFVLRDPNDHHPVITLERLLFEGYRAPHAS
jgi:hypothetical protein